jgi:cytochrome P450
VTARNLIAEDGERHTGLRKVVNRGFTPRRIAALETRVREVAAECVAKLTRRGESFDVIADLAVALPITIIAEMLGVEPERRADFKHWSNAILSNATGPARASPYSVAYARALSDMMNYLRQKARERRREPTDDLISAIVAEQDGEVGLSDREVIQFVGLLLVAGNETTTNLIGNAVSALIANADARERLAATPSLAARVVEETLRYDAPVQLVFRIAKEDTAVAGTTIRKGAMVAALIGSANRDERRFPHPDRFDLDREGPGHHVAFGFGRHYCLGAALAKLEARVALEELAPYLPRVHVDVEPEIVDSFLVRGPQRLVLRAD